MQEALQVQNIHTQCNLNKKHRIQPKILLYNYTVHMEKSSFCVDNHACHKEHAVSSWRTEQVVYSTQEGLQTEKKQTQCSRRFCSSSNLHSKLNPCRTNGQMRGQVATCCKSYVLSKLFQVAVSCSKVRTVKNFVVDLFREVCNHVVWRDQVCPYREQALRG